MGRADFYRAGSHNVICDRCGFKRKAEDMAMEWTGLRVCRDTCHETRHPQDFVRGVAEKQGVGNPRPDVDAVFLDVGDVTEDDL